MPAIADLPATLVIDASVGIKWVVDEIGSNIAVAVIGGRRLVVPALFWIETANALAAKARRGELTRTQAADAWRDLTQAPVQTRVTTTDSTGPALELAQDLAHSVYDCVYLALALREDGAVITADRRFAEIVRGQPSLATRLLLLDEVSAGTTI